MHKQKTPKQKQISVIFPTSDYEHLKAIALKNERSVGAQIREFVRKGLTNHCDGPQK